MQHRLIVLSIIALGYVLGYFVLDRWKTSLFYGDSNGYYLHVVSFFVNQDVGDYDKTITTLRKVNPQSADPREDKFGIRQTKKGRYYIKYTLGVPLLETPFFLLAHAYAGSNPAFDANGWSLPYRLLVSFAPVVYVLIGLWMLYGLLEKYYSKRVVWLTVFALAFATNLFFQATYVTMAHAFLFFDYCLLLALSYRFYQNPTGLLAFLIGGVVGLIGLTRVPELVSVFIPFLWGVSNWKGLKGRFTFFFQNYRFILLAAFGGIIVFSLQLNYWYYVSGALVFNPYDGEGFNFLKPNILKGFFDFRNGWLIYTPIMIFSLVGIVYLKRYAPAVFMPLLVFVGLHVHIHYSYYVWTFFPGLGQRPMVEAYALLSFGLAACFSSLLQKKHWFWLPWLATFLFTGLNLFQTWQMKEGIIWSERGNPAFYYATFGRLQPTKTSLVAYDAKILQPDSSSLVRKAQLAAQTFEGAPCANCSSIFKRSGSYAYRTGLKERDTLIHAFPLNSVKPGDWIRLEAEVYMHRDDQTWQRDKCLVYGLHFLKENGEKVREVTIKPSSHIGNRDFSIWTDGKSDTWEWVSFFVPVPKIYQKGWQARVFTYNRHHQVLYFDNIKVDHYIKREEL